MIFIEELSFCVLYPFKNCTHVLCTMIRGFIVHLGMVPHLHFQYYPLLHHAKVSIATIYSMIIWSYNLSQNKESYLWRVESVLRQKMHFISQCLHFPSFENDHNFIKTFELKNAKEIRSLDDAQHILKILSKNFFTYKDSCIKVE